MRVDLRLDQLVRLRAARAGITTTEFWGKSLVQLVLLEGFLTGWLTVSSTVLALSVAGLEGLYLTWRSAVKTWTIAKMKKDDEWN